MGFTILVCLSLTKLLLGLGADTVPLQKPFVRTENYEVLRQLLNKDTSRVHRERENKEPEVWR